jgi:hypothetical protein
MGRKIAFVLRSEAKKSSRELEAKRARDGMLYDASGKYWPKCSLLITPFENGKKEVSAGADYFGREAIVKEGHVDLPPRALGGWTLVGECRDVYYHRAGTKHPGPFHHEFDKPRGLWRLIWPFSRKAHGPALLYARRSCFRIEFPEGCLIDDRGIVMP